MEILLTRAAFTVALSWGERLAIVLLKSRVTRPSKLLGIGQYLKTGKLWKQSAHSSRRKRDSILLRRFPTAPLAAPPATAAPMPDEVEDEEGLDRERGAERAGEARRARRTMEVAERMIKDECVESW